MQKVYSSTQLDSYPQSWKDILEVKNIISTNITEKKWYQYIGDFFNSLLLGAPYKIGSWLGISSSEKDTLYQELINKKSKLTNYISGLREKAKNLPGFFSKNENTSQKVQDFISSNTIATPFLDKNENFLVDYVPSATSDELSSIEFTFPHLLTVDRTFYSKLEDPDFKKKLKEEKIAFGNRLNQEIISQTKIPLHINAAADGIQYLSKQIFSIEKK